MYESQLKQMKSHSNFFSSKKNPNQQTETNQTLIDETTDTVNSQEMREDLKHCLKASTQPPTTIKREEDDNHTGNWRPVSLTQTPKINCELVINI